MTRWRYSVAEEREALQAVNQHFDAAGKEVTELRRQVRQAWLFLLVLIAAGFALAMVNGCSGDPLMYTRDDAGAELAEGGGGDIHSESPTPPDAGKPACRALVPGDEIIEAPRTASGHTIVNAKCVTVCPALGGGVVCVLPGGVTTYCDGCL